MYFVKIFKGRDLSFCLLLLLACLTAVPHIAAAQAKDFDRDYAIEVAAMRSQDCAVELANGLASRGFEAYWLKASQPEYGEYYRVRVGRFQNLDIARAYAEKLLDSGLLDTCAVTYYEAPVAAVMKASVGGLSVIRSTGPIAFSCPTPTTADKSGSSPEELIAAITKSKWLVSAGKSVVYTLPNQNQLNQNQRSLSPAASPRDVVLMMRSIDKNRWRLKTDLSEIVGPPASAQQDKAQNAAIDSTSLSSLSSLKGAAESINTAINKSKSAAAGNSVEQPASPAANKTPVNPAAGNTTAIESSQIIAAATTAIPNSGANSVRSPVADINKRGAAPPRPSPIDNLGAPKLQASIELRNGQLIMKMRNLDQGRSFNGVARVTISDDKEDNDVAPLYVTLEPNEERVLPVSEQAAAYGNWMMMIFDDKQAVQLIRSSSYGQRPAPPPSAKGPAKQPQQSPDTVLTDDGEWKLGETNPDAPAQNAQPIAPQNVPQSAPPSSGSSLPNVTGTYDTTKPANAEPPNIADDTAVPQTPARSDGPVSVSSRQVAATADAITVEIEIQSPQPLGTARVRLRAGNYQDEKATVVSTSNGRVPFVIPAKDAAGSFSFEVRNEAGRVLGSGSGDLRILGQGIGQY